MISLENLNCLYYHELKYPRFKEVTWIFEQPVLSRGKIVRKSKSNFLKDMANFMKSLENLHSSYYHELKSLQK